MDRGSGPRARAGGSSGRGIVLADTSAWIEHIRETGSDVDRAMVALGSRGVALTGPVTMELLSGAKTEPVAIRMRTVLAGVTNLDVVPLDYELAAAIYRACRRIGHTMRNQLDCLIAAVAIRHGVPLLHNDADFDRIAELAPLEVYEPA